MWILLVEDDPDQAELIKSKLSAEFGEYEVRVIPTESEFRRWLDQNADDVPAAVVMDIMLRWCDVGPDMPEPPADVRAEGFSRAGVRCCHLMRQNFRTRSIPITVFSVLDANGLGLPEGCLAVPKVSDSRLLLEVVEVAVRRRGAAGSEVFGL